MEKDSLFILNGKNYRFSFNTFFINCEANLDINEKEYHIPINVSHEALGLSLAA